MGLLKYSNGWGHLIMSLATMAAGLYLIVMSKDSSYVGIGFGLLTLVTSAWFVPGAAKQVAYQVEQQQASAQTAVQTAAVAAAQVVAQTTAAAVTAAPAPTSTTTTTAATPPAAGGSI